MGLLVLGLAPALSAPACDGCGEWVIPDWAIWAVGIGEKVPDLDWGTMELVMSCRGAGKREVDAAFP